MFSGSIRRMTRTRITRTRITKITAMTNSRSRRNRTKNSSSWRKNGQKSGKRPKLTLKPSPRIWAQRQGNFCNI